MARILVIDDDPVVLLTIRVVLEQAGHVISEAHDGVEGEKALKHSQPDMVITDMFMPRQTGAETIRRLRAQGSTLKILLLSGGGHSVLDVQDEAHRCGADAALLKPFDVDELIEAVALVLAKKPPVAVPMVAAPSVAAPIEAALIEAAPRDAADSPADALKLV